MEFITAESNWNGYKKIDFKVNGRESFLICPKTPVDNNAWVWRAEFFGAFDYADRELLRQGRYLAYHAVSDMYGCPESIRMMYEFYLTVTSCFGLSAKPSLFGFSRGGLYTVNFAAEHPDCVSCIYLDAPVTDIRSWPAARLSDSDGSRECTVECMRCYGLKTEDDLMNFRGNPNDKAAKLAKDGVPVILVAGDSDTVVPYMENGFVFINNFTAAACETPIKVIVKKGCNHHPHSLENPTPIVSFITEYDRI